MESAMTGIDAISPALARALQPESTGLQRRPRTAMLVMPFGLLSFPAIGVSSLKAVFKEQGYALDVKYCNFDFVRRIGLKEYQYFVNSCSPFLTPEFVFARAFDPETPEYSEFFYRIVPPGFSKRAGPIRDLYRDAHSYMDRVASKVPEYLDDLERDLDLSTYDIIGFTSSFGQNSASWAFAKRIRRRYPRAVIMFGGANCEGVMGQAHVDAFDFIDFACTGEGETCVLELVRWIEDPAIHPFPRAGIVSRQHRFDPQSVVLTDIHSLPLPDYDDYFEQIEKHPDWRRWYFGLPMESSRGCWWGQKSQCLFCGCNGTRLKYRYKPAAKFVAELRAMRARYGEKAVTSRFLDNIMPHTYLDELLPLLEKDRPYESMFYEIKSNLRPDQIRRLRDVGINFMQPGIESLSTPVLKLMRKGVTALANVQTIKYATEYGVWVLWSILCGFPGEKPEHYRAIAEWIPKLYHLNPPRNVTEISIDRNSPLQRSPAAYGMQLQPAAAYAQLYRLPERILEDLAYWFENRAPVGNQRPRRSYFEFPEYARCCSRQVQIWQHAFLKKKDVRFDYEATDAGLELIDTRSGTEIRTCLAGIERAIVESALSIAGFRSICANVQRAFPAASEAEIRGRIESLVAASHLLAEEDRYLFLGLSRRELQAQGVSRCWLATARQATNYVFS